MMIRYHLDKANVFADALSEILTNLIALLILREWWLLEQWWFNTKIRINGPKVIVSGI